MPYNFQKRNPSGSGGNEQPAMNIFTPDYSQQTVPPANFAPGPSNPGNSRFAI